MNIGGWAVRPPAEVVYENLERFFPDADLDRPIVLDPPGMSPQRLPAPRLLIRASTLRITATTITK